VCGRPAVSFRALSGGCCALVGLLAGTAAADVFNMGGIRNPDGTWVGLASLETVLVQNPGNPADLRVMNDGTGGRGSVSYAYFIGRYEVTAAQYCLFLNAVAASDPYGLYNPYMDYEAHPDRYGCNIRRSGSPGSYTYSVAPDWANRPVNHVSWGDAARFVNWLHNGQPIGAQGPGTTETGAYTLNGAMTVPELRAVTRNPGWRWALPTEDEWYKAAYHKNDGLTAHYWEYPTGADAVPSNALGIPTDPGNNATYSAGYGSGFSTIGAPYWRTEVGAHENSASPYGTFDQGGNVWEWNETMIDKDGHARGGMRGGSSDFLFIYMHASCRFYAYTPTYESSGVGFRVCAIPEPVPILMLALTGLAGLRRKRTCRRPRSVPSG